MLSINETAVPEGSVRVVLTDSTGAVKFQYEGKNLIVQTGKNFLAGAVVAASPTPFSNIAIGTGVVAATNADTTLGTEVARLPFAGAVVANVASLSVTFPAGTGSGALTEAGIFNAVAAGVMLSRIVFPVINKAATDSLAITWNITVG